MAQPQRRSNANHHDRPFNRPFEKLGSLVNPQPVRKPSLPNLYTIGQDGVDHINVNYDGLTELGYALHQNSEFHFIHNLFGPFFTIEGFYRWLSCETDQHEFRTFNAAHCAQLAKRTTNHVYVPNLPFLVMDATLQKINTYPDLRDALGASTLPFDSYRYTYDNVNGQRVATRVRFRNASWVVEGLTVIRKAIQDGVEPDLGFLLDDKRAYETLVEKAKRSILPEEQLSFVERKRREQRTRVEPVKPVEVPVESVAVEAVKPKIIPNPPGTGKQAMKKKRRLERERLAAEAGKDKATSDVVALVPVSVEGASVVAVDIQSVCNNVLDENRDVAMDQGIVEAALNMSGIETPDALKEMQDEAMKSPNFTGVCPGISTGDIGVEVEFSSSDSPAVRQEAINKLTPEEVADFIDMVNVARAEFGTSVAFPTHVDGPDRIDTGVGISKDSDFYLTYVNNGSGIAGLGELDQTSAALPEAVEIGTSPAFQSYAIDSSAAALPESVVITEATTNFGSFGVPSQQSFVAESTPVSVDKVEEVKPDESSEQESH